MQRINNAHNQNARRISAHRQTWFETNSLNVTAETRRHLETNIRSWDSQADSRWREYDPASRTNVVIFDLIDAQNVRARNIADAVDANNLTLAQSLSKKDAPTKLINELLQVSNLPIEISGQEHEKVLATKSGSPPYSIAELSDGERNALLIASNVLTAKGGTLILIDEPERHLHRSIISPLLTHLFALRPDCAFIVSTHEVMLPIDNPTTRTLLMRGCQFSGRSAVSWQCDLVTSNGGIDDEQRRDILGSRRTILFVGGTDHSLDRSLYSLVFPRVSVIAKSSSRDVNHAVFGIRDANDLHWVRAFGVIDNDGRSQDDIRALRRRGVYALPFFSVESIYYHPEIQRRVAERQASVTGADASAQISNAVDAAIEAIKSHAQRLSERAAERNIREQVSRQSPTREQITAGAMINITVDVPAIITAAKTELETRLAARDIAFVVSQYPVRETPALSAIASNLGFQNRVQYENAVRKLLVDDSDSLQFVRSLFGSLPDDIQQATMEPSAVAAE